MIAPAAAVTGPQAARPRACPLRGCCRCRCRDPGPARPAPTFFTRFFLMTFRILFCCSISREMFRGRSSLSTTPAGGGAAVGQPTGRGGQPTKTPVTAGQNDAGSPMQLAEPRRRQCISCYGLGRAPRKALAPGTQRSAATPALTLDEGHPLGAQLLAVVHDEHAAHVQLDVVALLALVKQVKGRALGHKQHGLELQLALHCRGGGGGAAGRGEERAGREQGRSRDGRACGAAPPAPASASSSMALSSQRSQMGSGPKVKLMPRLRPLERSQQLVQRLTSKVLVGQGLLPVVGQSLQGGQPWSRA